MILVLQYKYILISSITSNRAEATDDTSQMPITLSESVDRQTERPPEYHFPTITLTDETDTTTTRPTTITRPTPTSRLTTTTRPTTTTNRPTSSRHSLTLTRDFLRRSFVRKSDSAKSIRSSLRRSFKYGGQLTTSHEQLVRDVEPISNTVAMSAMLSDDVTHTRSLGSVI